MAKMRDSVSGSSCSASAASVAIAFQRATSPARTCTALASKSEKADASNAWRYMVAPEILERAG